MTVGRSRRKRQAISLQRIASLAQLDRADIATIEDSSLAET